MDNIIYYTKEGRFKTLKRTDIKFGMLHNLDGPALIYADGTKVWSIDGMRHRIDGPAVYHPNSGFKVWWFNNQIHRNNGPAIIDPPNKKRKWYLYNQELIGVEAWLKENGIDKDNMTDEDIVAFVLRFS